MAKIFLDKALLVKGRPTPVEKQIKFLKKIMFNQEEYDKLLEDPEGYCNKQVPPIALDMEVLEQIHQIVMYDVAIDAGFAEQCGAAGIEALKSIEKTVNRLQKPSVDYRIIDKKNWEFKHRNILINPGHVIIINCTMIDPINLRLKEVASANKIIPKELITNKIIPKELITNKIIQTANKIISKN